MNDKQLWSSTTGEILCESHFGNYARLTLEDNPTAQRLVTPMTVWTRGTEEAETFTDDCGNTFTFTPSCESCDREGSK
jgi:hypothetical protein